MISVAPRTTMICSKRCVENILLKITIPGAPALE